jgi:hypothetical protein
MANNTRAKSVDLGVMQDNLIAARRQLGIDERALEKAHMSYDTSKANYAQAVQALKDATRVVLD